MTWWNCCNFRDFLKNIIWYLYSCSSNETFEKFYSILNPWFSCVVFYIYNDRYLTFNFDFYYRTHYTDTVFSGTFKPENWWILPDEESRNEIFIILYSVIVIASLVLIFAQSHFFAVSGFNSSKKIHNMSFDGVIRTNSSFFHNNPSGQ